MTWRTTESNPHFFLWEDFRRWPCLQQTTRLGCNVWEWCFLLTPQSGNNQASSLNNNAWRRSIERGQDTSGFVWTGLQANLCRLKRNFGDRKFYHESRRSLRNQSAFSNKTEHRHTRQRLCKTDWAWAFDSKIFSLHSRHIWTPSTLAYRRTLKKRLVRHATATQMR